jgi:mRNA interferase YafQ
MTGTEEPAKRSPEGAEASLLKRELAYTISFRKDFKRERRGRYRGSVEADLNEVIGMLANDLVIPARYSDHYLSGAWKDHRDCHVRPDLVLIYRKTESPPRLTLVRLGSHSELGF